MMKMMVNTDKNVLLAEMFRLLGDPTRLRIVFSCLDHPVAVGDIAMELALSPSLVSHHLRHLRAARVVRADRQGKNVFYVAADDHIRSVLKQLADHVGEPVDASDIEDLEPLADAGNL